MSDVMNPFATSMQAAPSQALANTDAQRAIAEVQAALMIARLNPRDPKRAMDLILQDCTRPGLAERASYAYARGGSDISGPSIRIAEAIASRWGNLQYGIRELEQRNGESVVQAFAWDVETNTRREVTFTVAHVRDTKRGRVQLEDARDIYEMTANSGMRRVRACLLGVIPGDVVEAALKQCDLTLKAKADVTPDRITSLVEFFATHGVTREQIEKRIQRRLDALTPALLLQLGKIANSLKDGMSSPGDWFEVAAPATMAAPQRKAETSATAPTQAPAAAATSAVAPTPEPASAGQSIVDALDDNALDAELAQQTTTVPVQAPASAGATAMATNIYAIKPHSVKRADGTPGLALSVTVDGGRVLECADVAGLGQQLGAAREQKQHVKLSLRGSQIVGVEVVA